MPLLRLRASECAARCVHRSGCLLFDFEDSFLALGDERSVALIAYASHALLLQEAEAGVAVGRVRGVAGDAAPGCTSMGLPAGHIAVEVLVKAFLGGGGGVALEAVGIVERLGGDGGLCRSAADPLRQVARADREGMGAPDKPRPGVAVDAAGG